MLNIRALALATAVGTALQLAMVLAGHSNRDIAKLFAIGGMGISLIAGVLYAWLARSGTGGSSTLGGLTAGSACALIGIIVSYLLGDVPASILAIGTVSSAVTGALGGWAAKLFANALATVAVVALVAGTHTQQAAAQARKASATRLATTAAFSWLTGEWQGTLASGVGVAHVVFSEPAGGVMTGVMHLVSADNTVLVVELLTLADTPRGVEMHFRHFSTALEAYEQDFKQDMLLTSHTPERDVFENQVPYSKALMSTQARRTEYIRQPDGGFIGRSEILAESGKAAVIEGTYHRVQVGMK